MRIPKLALALTIRSRLLLLSGILVLVMVGSNLHMREQIAVGSDVVREQTQLHESVGTAMAALRAFGELKYWLTDLEVSWLNESEDMANQARAGLEEHLQTISAFAPDKVVEVRRHVEKFVKTSLEAVGAYVAENRVLGNSLVADARASVQIVDEILVTIADDLKQGAVRAEDVAHAAADNTLRLSIAVLLAATAFALFLTWLTLRAVLTPLKKMVVAMTEVSKGCTDVEVPLVTRDEIGELAQALGVFKENAIEKERLYAQQEELKKKAEEERRQQMTKLADNFEASVKGVVDTVSSSVNALESTAREMSSIVEETNRQATAAAAASEQASSNVQTVSSAAEELASSIQEIARQVVDSANKAKSAVEDAERTNETMRGLSEGSQKIGEVVELISDIAGQTNLLALNATIEAARAGEAGRGFAVVASEVKSLANQTARATEDISAQIGAIQTATNEAVEAIKGIGEKIAEMDEIATQIAAAVEQQGAATGEISRSAHEAATGTQEVSGNVAGVTEAASETGAAASEVLRSAAELAKQAEMLRGEVDTFLASVRAA